MTRSRGIPVASAVAMEALGAALARAAPPGIHVHLTGELAAGKTTLARGYLRALGHAGAVKSPTFTLVESYLLEGRTVHHFDLYRLAQATELEFIGIDEYLADGADCLIEWADRGAGVLPPADVALRMEVTAVGRTVHLAAGSARGGEVLEALNEQLQQVKE
jgi:tRNA threonylcarbamoyladenosine biosynthesis protein TsaE